MIMERNQSTLTGEALACACADGRPRLALAACPEDSYLASLRLGVEVSLDPRLLRRADRLRRQPAALGLHPIAEVKTMKLHFLGRIYDPLTAGS